MAFDANTSDLPHIFLKTGASKKKKKKKNNKKKAKVQTEPPTIPMSVLFPSKIYPQGEICDYKEEYATP